jgi:hypothetical protein
MVRAHHSDNARAPLLVRFQRLLAATPPSRYSCGFSVCISLVGSVEGVGMATPIEVSV